MSYDLVGIALTVVLLCDQCVHWRWMRNGLEKALHQRQSFIIDGQSSLAGICTQQEADSPCTITLQAHTPTKGWQSVCTAPSQVTFPGFGRPWRQDLVCPATALFPENLTWSWRLSWWQ